MFSFRIHIGYAREQATDKVTNQAKQLEAPKTSTAKKKPHIGYEIDTISVQQPQTLICFFWLGYSLGYKGNTLWDSQNSLRIQIAPPQDISFHKFSQQPPKVKRLFFAMDAERRLSRRTYPKEKVSTCQGNERFQLDNVLMNDIIKILLNHPRDKPLSEGLLAGVLQALLISSTQPPTPPSKETVGLSMMDDDQLIGTKELAFVLQKSQSTVEKMRRETDKGPRYQPGGKARYRVGDVRDWMAKRTVANTTEATVKGLSHFILEDTNNFPLFRYADGSMLGLEAAIQYEEDHPETFCESFAVVNMGNAWEKHKDLSEALLKNTESATEILKNPSVAKNFDIAYWLFIQFIGGRLDNYQPLLKAIRMLVKHGTDINSQNNMTGYNLAHVLAINENGFINQNDFYNFMTHLLDMGMDVDLMSHESMSGRDIAEQNDSDPSTSNFLEVISKRDFANSLKDKLQKND